MLKGYRTYITAGLLVLSNILTAAAPNLQGKTSTVVNAILGLLTIYFRSQATK